MKLDASQLNMLRDEFDARQGGLSMEEFISVMSKSLPSSAGVGSDRLMVQCLLE